MVKPKLKLVGNEVYRFNRMGLFQCQSCGRLTYSASCGCPNMNPLMIDPNGGWWIPAPEEDWCKARR